MISMKVEFDNNKIIVYLYQCFFDYHDIDKLNSEIKKIIIKLIKRYNLEFFGYNIVHLYHNKYYGSVLEIENIYYSDFNINVIDLKLIIHHDNPFYLEMNDYYEDIENKKIIFFKGKFYYNLENVDNILKIIEFGKIIYKKSVLLL